MTSVLNILWEFKQSKLELPESHLAFVLRLCNVLYILSRTRTNIGTSQTFSELIQKAKSKLFSSNSTPQNRVREALVTVQGRRSVTIHILGKNCNVSRVAFLSSLIALYAITVFNWGLWFQKTELFLTPRVKHYYYRINTEALKPDYKHGFVFQWLN